MNTLQDKVLQNYKLNYPAHSLKDISRMTNIQVTRVFRLFNGAEMKVSELEAFQNVINKSHYAHATKLNNLIQECSQKLSKLKINKVIHELESLLKMESYIKSNKQSEYQLSC